MMMMMKMVMMMMMRRRTEDDNGDQDEEEVQQCGKKIKKGRVGVRGQNGKTEIETQTQTLT